MSVPTTSARRFVISLIVLASVTVFAGCTSTPVVPADPGPPPSSAVSAPSTASGDVKLPIAITIAGDQVSPSGRKLDAAVGTTIELNVTSDRDDAIHAHIGGDGYELEVKANTPTSGSFILTSPGSFEVESHHLEKIIVILNVR